MQKKPKIATYLDSFEMLSFKMLSRQKLDNCEFYQDSKGTQSHAKDVTLDLKFVQPLE